MLLLTNASDELKVITTTNAGFDVFVGYADLSGGAVDVGNALTSGSAAGTYTCCTGAAATKRNMKVINVINRDTALSCRFTVYIFTAAMNSILRDVTLAPGESLSYDDQVGWNVYDASGRVEVKQAEVVPIAAEPYTIFKVGTAAEAAGVDYCFAKDAGNPGAWSPGTPGINGRATDGTDAADAGCVPLKPAAAGKTKALLSMLGSANQVATLRLMDVLWVNTGIAVATTTAQAIASAALPPRDIDSAVNGKGCMVGLLVTVATTNAAAIATITLNYTNSAGVAGRTATIATFPASAVVGTVVWFLLAAGDIGVSSIQGITLGTSLVAGSVSLIVARPYCIAASPSASYPSIPLVQGNLPVPENACLLLFNSAALIAAVQANFVLTAQDI